MSDVKQSMQVEISRSLGIWKDVQKMIWFEDSFGLAAYFPLEWVQTPDASAPQCLLVILSLTKPQALHSILKGRFQDKPGYEMVCNRQYVLNDVETDQTLVAEAGKPVLRTGQKVYMSMLFGKSKSPYQLCPGCHADGQVKNKETIWYAEKAGIRHHAHFFIAQVAAWRIDRWPKFGMMRIPSSTFLTLA